jgi:poly(3-hydroxybutyrate) depolymerase
MRKKFLSLPPNRFTVLLISLLFILILLLLWWNIQLIRSNSSGTNEAHTGAAIPLLSESVKTGLASVTTANYANRNLEYFYFFPGKFLKQPQLSYPVLIVVPGLSGSGQNAVQSIFRKAAIKNGWIILAPSFNFDQSNWKTATSYQFPAVWSGQALLDIINDFSSRQQLKLGRLFLHGVSAGAQFAVRFALWRPELCLAVSAQAGGGTITPEKFVPVKFFISIGRLDTSRMGQFNWFLEKASKRGISVESKIYEGGHGLPFEQIEDSIRFFEKAIAEPSPPSRSPGSRK